MSVVDRAVYERMAVSNFSRLTSVLDILGGSERRYQDRVHLPLLDGLVCIHPDDDSEPVEHTGQLTAEDHGDLIVVTLDEFLDPAGTPTKIKGIRLPEQQKLTRPDQTEFDGFCFQVVSQGYEVLRGIRGDTQFALGAINDAPADEFGVACLIPLENRASPHYQPTEPTHE